MTAPNSDDFFSTMGASPPRPTTTSARPVPPPKAAPLAAPLGTSSASSVPMKMARPPGARPTATTATSTTAGRTPAVRPASSARGTTPAARGTTSRPMPSSAGRTSSAARGTTGRGTSAGRARGARPTPTTTTTTTTGSTGVGYYGSGSTVPSTHLSGASGGAYGAPAAATASSSDWFSQPTPSSQQQPQPQANPYASGTLATPYGHHTQQPQANQWQQHQPTISVNQWQQPSLQPQQQSQQPGSNFFLGGAMSQGSSGTDIPSTASTYGVSDDADFENEPPLLEELGINIGHILAKTKAVILPFQRVSGQTIHMDPSMIVEDADLAGPLMFALALGGELLMTGKLHFGYIYGFGLFGCLSMTLVLNLMTQKEAISVWTVTSILGYSLLPVNILAAVKIVVVNIIRLETFGRILALLAVLWSTVASTRLLEVGCGMRPQRYLIGYPIALLYSAFVLMTIF